MSFAYKSFSPELQDLMISYFKEEVLPDRKSYCDDSDLALIVDALIDQGFLENN